MCYLVCEKCGGYYKLQRGESPNDFTKKCECGGNLIYSKTMVNNYMCVDIKCKFAGTQHIEGRCPECNKQLHKVDSKEAIRITNNKKEYSKNPKTYQKTRKDVTGLSEQINGRKRKLDEKRIFGEDASTDIIKNQIFNEMDNFASKGSVFKLGSIGSALTANAMPTNWLLVSGFNDLMEQNKILNKIIIRQNELVYRELKRLNENLEKNNESTNEE
ncbi:hypothetical protein [Methanobacterium aggregans]|uniref:hypothetical protein n=1 Tax=Methanobacterium aggregans TaxID=1615586 RepID=UPI001AEAA201|nr:hypothetical protein [Methanobacterium aggregans]MBP2045188.1 hypothetical protein [Methanobacterium aggregans]